jgi:8-oxo-dGTP pyrophosphatase MutT (NUDIX family)
MDSDGRAMIVHDEDGVRFNLRAAAVITGPRGVLLHRGENDPFWSLPGGRVEMMEDSPSTILREMQEELGITCEVQRLLWLAENFFTYEGVSYHEICLYFQLNVTSSPPWFNDAETFTSIEDRAANQLIFQWVPQDEQHLRQFTILPAFLTYGLITLPSDTIHMVEMSSE